ncbi:MurR/RpiR family transcriptional regulator [Longibaculum muris]|uniref:MurR/RpiR family transcriptional regulator n=1 Tax=Longibaculum muris TaxID=1796628 RepID=UPI003AB3588A
MAESFQHNMMEIGKRVELVSNHYFQYWMSSNYKEDDVVVIISYASRAVNILDIAKELKQSKAKIVLISSIYEKELSKLADYHLYFSSYEDFNHKIASFSSRISLQYLLDCLYACYFNRDYDKHLQYRIDHYKG